MFAENDSVYAIPYTFLNSPYQLTQYLTIMIELKENNLVIKIDTFQAANHYLHLLKSLLNVGIASIGTVDEASLAEGISFVRDILPDEKQIEKMVIYK